MLQSRVVLEHMKATTRTSLALRLERILLVAFALIIVLLPLHAFISTWGGTAIGPLLVWKSWKEILLVALLPLVVWYCLLRPDVAGRLWRSWLTKLILVYALLQVVFAIVSQASVGAVLDGLLVNLRFLAMLLLAGLLYYADDPWLHWVKCWLPKWLFITTIVLSLMAIAQVTIVPRDFLAHFGYNKDTTIAPYLVVDQNPNALRAFATLRGPNPFGAYLLLPLAVALVTVVRQRRNVLAGLALGLGVIALVLSSSRSAWLGAGAGVIVLAITLVPHDKLVKWIKWGTLPAIILIGAFFWLATTVPSIRIAVFHSRPDRPTLTTGSDDKHWQEVTTGIKDAWQHPLGQGVGVSGPASFYNTKAAPKVPESYYVQLAQEVGWAGLALFVAINVIVAVKLWQRRQDNLAKALLASFIGVTVINLFLHGWADDPTSMTWWGIAGLYLFADNKK